MNNLTIKQTASEITCDLVGVKEYLNEQLEIYRNMVFTEETKKEAKTSVAELRKEKKSLEDNIKSAKSEYMKVWDGFYEEAKQVVALFDEPINLINHQIEEFEESRKAKKKEQIEELYQEIIASSEIAEHVTLEKIFNPKWENATYAIATIKADMNDLVFNCKAAVTTIKALGSEVEDKALAEYYKDFDLNKALAVITSYEEAKKIALQKEREREEERIRAEERAKLQREMELKEELAKKEEQPVEEAHKEVAVSEPVFFVSYDMHLTGTQKDELVRFLNSRGIEFEEVMPF